jgi:hypothetical protein
MLFLSDFLNRFAFLSAKKSSNVPYFDIKSNIMEFANFLLGYPRDNKMCIFSFPFLEEWYNVPCCSHDLFTFRVVIQYHFLIFDMKEGLDFDFLTVSFLAS